MISKLFAVYKEIFSEKFNNTLDSRIRMQKIIYILISEGIYFDDFNFIWDLYGPYSRFLDNIIKHFSNNLDTIGEYRFTLDELNKIKKLKKFIKENENKDYSITSLLEALASIKYIMRYENNDKMENIISILKQKKPALSNVELNKIIYNYV